MKTLIIGSGPSASKLPPGKYNLVIGLNDAFMIYDSILDYHLVLEQKPLRLIEILNKRARKNQISKATPRIVSQRSANKFHRNLNVQVYTRGHFTPKTLDLRNIEDRTLLWTYNNRKETTALTQAIHLACSLNATEIHLTGCELSWRKGSTKYFHGDALTKARKVKLSPVLRTTEGYQDTAETIKALTPKLDEIGVTLHNHSGGLLDAT